jgi:hypothetical protein
VAQTSILIAPLAEQVPLRDLLDADDAAGGGLAVGPVVHYASFK